MNWLAVVNGGIEMSTTIFKVCSVSNELATEVVKVSELVICPEFHDRNIVFCSICGDTCFGDPDKVIVCSNCLEYTDGIVGTYRPLWDLSQR